MKDRLLNIVHIVLATICFALLVGTLESINPFAQPMPKGLDVSSPELANYMASQPLSAYLWIMLGYAIGSYGAGFILSRFSKNITGARISLAGGITALGVMNLYALPHPKWFWISLLIYFPFIYLGTRLYPKRELNH
jgi:hypothetical protein